VKDDIVYNVKSGKCTCIWKNDSDQMSEQVNMVYQQFIAMLRTVAVRIECCNSSKLVQVGFKSTNTL